MPMILWWLPQIFVFLLGEGWGLKSCPWTLHHCSEEGKRNLVLQPHLSKWKLIITCKIYLFFFHTKITCSAFSSAGQCISSWYNPHCVHWPAAESRTCPFCLLPWASRDLEARAHVDDILLVHQWALRIHAQLVGLQWWRLHWEALWKSLYCTVDLRLWQNETQYCTVLFHCRTKGAWGIISILPSLPH